MARYFYASGSDTVPHVFEDWQPRPPGLAALSPNASLVEWAVGMNAVWLQLGRRVIPSVATFPQRHSLLYQPHPMVVPGGRFLEVYYWDSAWIVDGLVLCNMTNTALGVVLNLVHLSDAYGFIPNGGRI